MNELMIALSKLAAAGTEYLNALKVAADAGVVREDTWQKHRFELDKREIGVALPGAPETAVPAPKKAPKAAKVEEEKTPEAAAQTPQTPPTPAAQPAPVDPLGDTGAAAPAFQGAANPPAPKAAEEKPTPEAPKVQLTEVESKDELIKTMGTFLQLNKTKDSTIESIREIIRGILVENFKVAKINDLTHPQRVQAIDVFKAAIANMGKK